MTVRLVLAVLALSCGAAAALGRNRATPEPTPAPAEPKAPVRFRLTVFDDAGAELPDPAPLFEADAQLHEDAAVHDAFDALDTLRFEKRLTWTAAKLGGKDIVSSINGIKHALPTTAWIIFHTTAAGRPDGRRETRANVSPGAVLLLDGDELAFRLMPVGRAPPNNALWGGGPEGGMVRVSPTPTPPHEPPAPGEL